ncbi:MAG: hypothetical protein AABZ74_17030, partial [Cyanobacteriota bacterium]
MSGIGSNSFKNSFESIKLSDPSKKEAFKAALVDAAKDGKIENKELQNIKTNFLGKELSSGDQKSLNVLLQNLSSEVTNAFPIGSKINPDNVEKASVFLNNLLSNDVNVTSTTTDTSTKTPNTEPPVLKGHEDLVNRVKTIVGTDIFEKLAQKFSGNDKADPAKLLECFQGIDELTHKDSTIEQRALGLQKVFVAGGLGIGDVINKAAQPILEKAGIGIKIESGTGNEIKASIFIGKVVDNEQIEDGDDKEIKGGYIEAKFNIETHEYDFSAKFGKFSTDGEDVNSIASVGFSFKQTSEAIEEGSTNIVDYATQGTIVSNGEDPELKDLVNYTTELGVLPDSVRDDMKLRGIAIDDKTKKFFSVEVDLEGKIKTRLILQKEDNYSTKEKPSFKQYSIDLDVDAAKFIVDAAEGASKALINKYGPQIAANVVAKVGAKAAV